MKRLIAIVVAVGATVSLSVTDGWAQRRTETVFVTVPFHAEEPAPEQMESVTVGQGEPFLLRRLVAVKSATLGAAASFRATFGVVEFAEGSQLVMAQGVGGSEFFCGSYTPGATERLIGNTYRVQWACLQDADQDGVFERAFSAPDNAGAYLPSFNFLQSPVDVSAPYSVDAPEGTIYFETAYIYEQTFNLYGRIFFYQKIRRPGDSQWSNIASIGRGVQGGYTAVPGRPLPQTFELGGARIALTGKADGTVTVDPITVESGLVAFSTFGG